MRTHLGHNRKYSPYQKEKKHTTKVNQQITAVSVRLVSDNGQEVLALEQALQKAASQSLDLVEIVPTADPPVCKILDFKKFQFDQKRKKRELKKKQRLIKLKEVRMQSQIDSHDLQVKVRHISEFLEQGNKVKVGVRFKGRQMAHPEVGRAVLEKIQLELSSVALTESLPKMEGRMMFMILTSKDKKG